MRQKEIKWLYDELPGLVESGVIPAESAEALQAHYGPLPVVDESSRHSLSFLITGTLGALLIGAGIITLFAYNWDDIGRPLRAFCAILPLAVAIGFYSYAFMKKRESTPWIESTSGFLSLMLVSSMALIGQTYNMGGSIKDLLLSWLILSIPLLYLKRATMPFIIFMAGLAWRATLWGKYDSSWDNMGIYFILLLAATPFIYKALTDKNSTATRNITGWMIVLNIGISVPFVLPTNDLLAGLIYGCLASLFYLAGKYYFNDGEHFWNRPFQTCAIIGSFILSIFYSFDVKLNSWHSFSFSWEMMAFYSLVAAGCGFYLYSNLRSKRYINPFPVSTVVMVGLVIFLGKSGFEGFAMATANLFLLGYGILYLRQGVTHKKMSLVNMGMFFISSLVLARFFDSNLGFVIKGLAFILVGSGFLLTNLFLNRKLKRNENLLS